MFRRHWLIAGIEDEQIDSIMMAAANFKLLCLHKIGVYGSERQNELYVIGTFRNYVLFTRQMRKLVK